MMHVVETSKDVDTAERDLAEAVARHGFGVLQTYDMRAKMKEKGVAFPHECRILEVCNPKQAARVLTANMDVNLALPCRLSVYEKDGRTHIGMLLPSALMGMFPGSDALRPVAEEVEDALKAMVEDAR